MWRARATNIVAITAMQDWTNLVLGAAELTGDLTEWPELFTTIKQQRIVETSGSSLIQVIKLWLAKNSNNGRWVAKDISHQELLRIAEYRDLRAAIGLRDHDDYNALSSQIGKIRKTELVPTSITPRKSAKVALIWCGYP